MIDLNLDIFFSLEQQERDYGEWIKWKDKPVLWRKSEQNEPKYHFYLRPIDIPNKNERQANEATGNISLFITNNEEKNNIYDFLYFFLMYPCKYMGKLSHYNNKEIFTPIYSTISTMIIVNFMAHNMCAVLDSLPPDSTIFKELINIVISKKQSYKEQEFLHCDMLCKLKLKEKDNFYFSPESLNILNSSQLIKIYENTEESLQEITTHIVKKYLEERNINPC